jgi:L-malate glycosyltransferase
VRILHVDGATTWRGGQNQVLLASLGMARRGHDVTVACQKGGALEARAQAAGLRTHPIRLHGDLSPTAALSLARLSRALPPDVVHAHDSHALAAAVLASSVSPANWLVATRRVDFALGNAVSRWKYRRCARVIAVSEAVRAVLQRNGLPSERLRLVHDGVSDRPARPGGREALRALGFSANSLVVGNVAALTDHKDHATLVDAAAEVCAAVPRARFIVVGTGELRADIERRVQQRGLADRFLLAGFRDDVDALLPAFDVFCLSSHMEGLGTSLLDAMMFGVPIVATAAGGIPEAIEDRVSGRLVPPRRAELLAAALIETLNDAELRAQLARAARRRYESEFGVDRMTEQTLQVYEERPCKSAQS